MMWFTEQALQPDNIAVYLPLARFLCLNLKSAQIFLGRAGDALALGGKTALMTGTFDDLFIFKKVNPAAEMGTGSGDGKGLFVARKKKKIPFSMVAGKR